MKDLLNRLVDISHERLKKNRQGFEYLVEERQISVETIKREVIGFIDEDVASSFLDNVDTDIWTHPKDYYMKMMVNTVMLPIRDDTGIVIGISTKVPEKGSKGWWNSIFSKENILYGLNRAKNHAFRKNKIYLVEGYADAITLWQHGLPNAVAVMGTAFTDVQKGLVLRYCNNVCVCFDSDPDSKDGKMGGGQAGLERLVRDYNNPDTPLFFNVLSAIVIPMGEDGKGDDPDGYVKKNGIKDYLSLEKRILLD